VLTDADTWTIAAGAALPPIIAIINQRHWAPQLKAVVALAVCFLASLGLAALRGPLDWHDWRRTAVLVTGAALATYRWLWQPSQIAPAIEAATSTGPAPLPDGPRRTP
jgi:hypothetical protein